jgi:electron transport complex protein RnfG
MNAQRIPVRSILALAMIGLAAAILLSGLNELTREPIEQARAERAQQTLNQVLAPERYDNLLTRDSVRLRIDGSDELARVYRARLNGEPSAAVIDVTTPRGYSGDIRLLIAVNVTGEVLSVRVLEHRETPGLGDKIEIRRSDWIEQFNGRSIGDPARGDWASNQRGGEFDTLTSATITSTAVIDAVARSLEAYAYAREEIWSASPGTDAL